jgi:hypothetical protein
MTEIPPNATIRQEYVKCDDPDCQNSHGLIFISLSGVILVEAATMIALSFLTGRVLSSTSHSTGSGVDFGTDCFSSERT